MKWSNLYRSVFSILRVQGNQVGPAGTGFVISINPIRVLTCYHVVSGGTEDNNGTIRYSITKRSGDSIREFDIRKAEISFLRAKKMFFKPDFDFAILEIDPAENIDVANKLELNKLQALSCSFSAKDREIGTEVQWLSLGILGDKTFNPRFFTGKIVSNFINSQKFKFKNSKGQEQEQLLDGVRFIEIDQLFVPGCSGGPIVNSSSGKLIGYIHGFNSWPILTNTVIEQDFELTNQNSQNKYKAKYNLPLTTSLSLGIDLSSIHDLLLEEGFIKKNSFFN